MSLRTVENVKEVITAQVPPNFKGVVTLRCKEASFGPSKGTQQPQITLKCEIVRPLEITSDFDNRKYNLDSSEVTIYLSLAEKNSKGEDSRNLRYLIEDLLPLLGFPAQIDDENPLWNEIKNPGGIKFEGICFDCVLASEQRKEQRKNSKGEYEPIRDNENKEIIRGWQWSMVSANSILRRVNMEVNRPF